MNYFLFGLIYLFIGFLIVFVLSKFSDDSDDNSPWIIIYGLGTIFWPLLIVSIILFITKKI